MMCKIFNHKWQYAFIVRNNERIYLRSCKRCNKLQWYKSYMTSMIWSNAILYTNKGAKEDCLGYGLK